MTTTTDLATILDHGALAEVTALLTADHRSALERVALRIIEQGEPLTYAKVAEHARAIADRITSHLAVDRDYGASGPVVQRSYDLVDQLAEVAAAAEVAGAPGAAVDYIDANVQDIDYVKATCCCCGAAEAGYGTLCLKCTRDHDV